MESKGEMGSVHHGRSSSSPDLNSCKDWPAPSISFIRKKSLKPILRGRESEGDREEEKAASLQKSVTAKDSPFILLLETFKN